MELPLTVVGLVLTTLAAWAFPTAAAFAFLVTVSAMAYAMTMALVAGQSGGSDDPL